MIDVLLIIALALICLVGALLTVFQLPGIWLVAATAAAYGWYYDWQRLGPWMVGAIVGIAVAAEVGEHVTGMWFTAQGGGSRRAAWWGLFGGMAGALLLSIPVPVIGTILGAAVGCFTAALAAELSQQRTAAAGAKVGLYAAAGRTLGTVLKIAASLVMSGVAVVSAIVG